MDQYASSADLYSIKRGVLNGFSVPYLLQGLNGPCPLLAICNVLLLRGAISLPEESQDIKFDVLVEKLGNLLLEKNKASDTDVVLRSRLNDSVMMLPSLNKGLDVNVKFTGVDSFEHSRELAVFDLLDVRVYHGWIVSEEDLSAYPYLSPLTYNEAIEKVVAYDAIKSRALETGNFDQTPEEREAVEEGEAIAKWLEANSGQLTSDGVIQLNSHMKEGELAVLFRNNHFSVILKRNDRLFGLVTDVGFRRTGIMWESIDQLDGDTAYLDAGFSPAGPTEQTAGPNESDYEMALRLQYEQQNAVPASRPQRDPRAQQCCACTVM